MKTKKKPVGRPAKITLEVVEQIGKRIAIGMPIEDACILSDVKLKSFEMALSRNEEFVGVVKRHKAEFLNRALSAISNGGEFDSNGRRPWTGLAWILERRHKPHFNRTDTHAITDEKGNAFMTDKDMQELERMTKEMVAKGVKHG